MQISSEEVEFQRMNIQELQLSEHKKLYPPRFVITVTKSSAAEDSLLGFTIEGATQEIVKYIPLILKGDYTGLVEAKLQWLGLPVLVPECVC